MIYISRAINTYVYILVLSCLYACMRVAKHSIENIAASAYITIVHKRLVTLINWTPLPVLSLLALFFASFVRHLLSSTRPNFSFHFHPCLGSQQHDKCSARRAEQNKTRANPQMTVVFNIQRIKLFQCCVRVIRCLFCWCCCWTISK